MFVIWSGFFLFVAVLVALELGFLERTPRIILLKESLIRSALWVTIGLAFSGVIYDGFEHHRFGLGTVPDAADGRVNDGASAASKYLTGFVLEKVLSADNLFVMAVIFRFLRVPPEYQHRVLFWGILGVLLLRGLLIGVGLELILHFHWVLYLLGLFLLYTGFRLLVSDDRPPDPQRNPVLIVARKLLPLTPRYDGGRFATREFGRLVLTPLALALILVETTDVMFATDSVPAVFGVTADPLIVFTSNILAVLGLRSLYFAVSGLIDRFRHAKAALAIVLLLIGLKMLAGRWLQWSAGEYGSLYLLASAALILACGFVASRTRAKPGGECTR